MIILSPPDPVAINLFGIAIRWYALAYIAAFVIGLWLIKKIDRTQAPKYWDDLFSYVILGIILGGRLGYVLFYNLPHFAANPLEIFYIWHGGMAFHGGLVGAAIGALLYAWKVAEPRSSSLAKRGVVESWLLIIDRIAIVAPIGLFFGRIANFINMEAMGRITDKPWGIMFKGVTDAPRHPSQLYEAATEGIILFIIMMTLWRFTRLRERPGALAGMFGIGYAVFRIFCEQFREPDLHIGFLLGTNWLTMGTVLSSSMILIGSIMVGQSVNPLRWRRGARRAG